MLDLSQSNFLNSIQGKKVDKIPIWIMRQAGRYLPEYRECRKNFKDFMDLCRNTEVVCELALQPLRRFDLDAGILFSDILTIPEAMGLPLKFVPNKGPIFDKKILVKQDILNLNNNDIALEKLNYVFDAVKEIRKNMPNNLPLIGFSGSPWTLSTYMVEGQGSKQYLEIRKMLYKEPSTLHLLLKKLSDNIILYLKEQVKAGANVLMIFDSWGGILTPQTYQEFSLNYMQQIIIELKKFTNIPIILFTKGGYVWLDEMAKTDADVLGIDWTINIKDAFNKVGLKKTIQGNLDPATLYGSDKVISQSLDKIILAFKERNTKYIFNLGHGIYKDIKPEKVKFMIDYLRDNY